MAYIPPTPLGIQKRPEKIPMGENSKFSPRGITSHEVIKQTTVMYVYHK